MQVPKWLLQFLGDSYICIKPFFYMFKPEFHKVKGFEIRQILNNIKPGDILFRTFDGYLNTILTPGLWSHAAIYIGDNTIIHAVGAGVVKEDILDFCRTDSIALCRVKNSTEGMCKNAINKAEQLCTEHISYDWQFKDNNGKVYCTELINIVYNGMFNSNYSTTFGQNVLTPDNLKNSSSMETIIQFVH